jgi:hypothetical protein
VSGEWPQRGGTVWLTIGGLHDQLPSLHSHRVRRYYLSGLIEFTAEGEISITPASCQIMVTDYTREGGCRRGGSPSMACKM